MKAPLLAALLAFGIYTAQAAVLEGRVVAVADDDTLTVLDSAKQQHRIRIRINGIDAPEKGQAFGERSKQNLSGMTFQKDARFECHKTDRYKRKVCKVWVQPADCPTCGKTLDVGHAQVIAGMAWWYRAYAKEQSAEDRGRCESAEDEARLRKWGLWRDKEPVPPWEFRRKR
jgi:endonuclease YncB( thermonuclease family)